MKTGSTTLPSLADTWSYLGFVMRDTLPGEEYTEGSILAYAQAGSFSEAVDELFDVLQVEGTVSSGTASQLATMLAKQADDAAFLQQATRLAANRSLQLSAEASSALSDRFADLGFYDLAPNGEHSLAASHRSAEADLDRVPVPIRDRVEAEVQTGDSDESQTANSADQFDYTAILSRSEFIRREASQLLAQSEP